MNLKSLNTNKSLLECSFSAWKLFSYLFSFIKQGEPVIALISKYYRREANFKIDQGKEKRDDETVS